MRKTIAIHIDRPFDEPFVTIPGAYGTLNDFMRTNGFVHDEDQYCQAGRIPGVTRFGRSWVIPADAKKPTDPRSIKTQSGADNEANH